MKNTFQGNYNLGTHFYGLVDISGIFCKQVGFTLAAKTYQDAIFIKINVQT